MKPRLKVSLGKENKIQRKVGIGEFSKHQNYQQKKGGNNNDGSRDVGRC